MLFNWYSDWRRRRILRNTRIDDAQWQRVESELPFLHPLDPDERRRLRELAVLFLHEKEMHGAAGLALTEDIRLSIALQACYPILNLGLRYYAGWVGIIVYPGGFLVNRKHVDHAGVVHEWRDELAGETSADGPVVLSWEDIAAASKQTDRACNVVIHEFAHKLDMLHKLDADGFPWPHAEMDARQWFDTLEAAYARFCRAVERGQAISGDSEALQPLDSQGKTLPFDAYGAEDPAEFFAVMSEHFFVTPVALQTHFGRLYEQLCLFYKQDTGARMHPKVAV
ncbi:MAG TPA: M90 family metallopeptidase [Burkholderiales bacterium]|nr:M90 family metallopeptidase [Burkholderiales bacterium]